MASLRIKKGDTVIVLSGKDKGRTGVVASVQPRDLTVTIEGINTRKRHRKPTQANPQGGVFTIEHPISISKVGLVHPTKKNQATRIGIKVDDKGAKTRVYRANGKEIK